MLVDFDVRGQTQEIDFFTERSIIMDSYFGYYNVLMSLLQTHNSSIHRILTDGLEW